MEIRNLLQLVVWPTAALERVPTRGSSEALGAHVFELAASGLSSYAIARQLGRPRFDGGRGPSPRQNAKPPS